MNRPIRKSEKPSAEKNKAMNVELAPYANIRQERAMMMSQASVPVSYTDARPSQRSSPDGTEADVEAEGEGVFMRERERYGANARGCATDSIALVVYSSAHRPGRLVLCNTLRWPAGPRLVIWNQRGSGNS
jgi:hypothetical protein